MIITFVILTNANNLLSQVVLTYNKKIISIQGGITFANQLGYPQYIANFWNSPWFWKVTPQGGINLNSQIRHRQWYIRTGIIYTFKGSTYRFFHPGNETFYGFHILYLDVPLQFGRSLSNNPKSFFHRISIQVGPQVSLRSYATAVYVTRDSVTGAYDVDKSNSNDEFKPFDILISSHLDVSLSRRFSIAFDYSQSILTAHTISYGQVDNPIYDYRNIAFQISIHYKFFDLWEKVFSRKSKV